MMWKILILAIASWMLIGSTAHAQTVDTDDLFDLSTALGFTLKGDWYAEADQREPVAVLGPEVLDGIAVSVLKQIVPENTSEGISVRALDGGLFIYRGDDGILETTRIQDRPPGISIARTYAPNDLKPFLLNEIESRLDARGIEARQALIVTGEVGPGAAFFLHVALVRHGTSCDGKFLADNRM